MLVFSASVCASVNRDQNNPCPAYLTSWRETWCLWMSGVYKSEGGSLPCCCGVERNAPLKCPDCSRPLEVSLGRESLHSHCHHTSHTGVCSNIFPLLPTWPRNSVNSHRGKFQYGNKNDVNVRLYSGLREQRMLWIHEIFSFSYNSLRWFLKLKGILGESILFLEGNFSHLW